MKAKLISRERGEFVFGPLATIGRAEGSTITLDATVVSSEHARISFDPKRSAYVLEDLGSLNGTKLDGVRIERKEFLGKLHLIRFGGSEDFIFQLLNVDQGTELDTIEVPPQSKTQVGGEVPVLPAALREEATGILIVGAARDAGAKDTGGTRVERDIVPVPEVLAEASAGMASKAATEPAFALDFVLEDRSPRFPLKEGENVIGRSETADIRLDFSDLSRSHATVTVSEGKVLARDEGSRNHTFVNGKQIEKEVVVPVGAQIVFGRLEAQLVAMPVAGVEKATAKGGKTQKGAEPK